MAKPARSPLLGYNHNVKYGGHIFHVQTEDSGPGNPHIFTHLFFEGSILGSKRCQYEPSASEDDVRGMMQAQHKAILKELKQGNSDERIRAFFEARGETFEPSGAIPAPAAPPAPMPEATVEPPPPLPLAPPVELAAAAVLDLDALPATPSDRPPTPEPLPMHLARPAVPGPGTYTFRRPSRETFSQDPPAPAAPVRPATVTARPTTVRPITPVVMQRQVVVGAGSPPATTRKVPTTPVRRRPVSGGPYVVKEGSHANIPGTVRGADQPHELVPPSEPAAAPRTAESPRPPQEAAPAAFVSDQSLDDVILAYLSQGEGKR